MKNLKSKQMKSLLTSLQTSINAHKAIASVKLKTNKYHQMKNNVLYLLTLVFVIPLSIHAQRGVRIGYIDTEFILENIPEYQEANAQLNEKTAKWKNEIDSKLNAIEKKRKDLSNEKALLTKELIDEREEDITFEENEILDYQQKRFGPNGDLFIQKKQLTQPIQDQIFAAVQDLAATKQYDFILDKSAEAIMLYSDQRFDLSEQVIRSITRTSKRKQAETKAELKAAKNEELLPEINNELEARIQALKEKKEQVLSVFEKAKQKKLDARAAKVKEAADRRQKILDDRQKAKEAAAASRTTSTEEKVEQKAEAGKTNVEKKVEETKKPETKIETNVEPKAETKTQAQLIEENKQKKLAAREARMKQLEDRKKKILQDRQKAKDSINNNK